VGRKGTDKKKKGTGTAGGRTSHRGKKWPFKNALHCGTESLLGKEGEKDKKKLQNREEPPGAVQIKER